MSYIESFVDAIVWIEELAFSNDLRRLSDDGSEACARTGRLDESRDEALGEGLRNRTLNLIVFLRSAMSLALILPHRSACDSGVDRRPLFGVTVERRGQYEPSAHGQEDYKEIRRWLSSQNGDMGYENHLRDL